jgi:hypothetical protein
MPKRNTDTRQFTRAQFVPSTLNEESRTVDVVFATPTPVLRYSWYREEYYNEVLDMKGANLGRSSERGLPVLDNHSSWGKVGETVIGRAENIRLEKDTWVATVRFSQRDEVQPLISDVRDGIITDISFGYSVDKIERSEKKDGDEYRTYYVRKWTPNEISFVSIPADPRAGVRSSDGENKGFDLPEVYSRQNPDPKQISTQTNNGQIMKREQIIAMLAKRGVVVDETITDEALQAELERALNPEGTDPKAVNAAIEAERKRSQEIISAVRSAKLPNDFAEKLVTEGKTIDEARAAIIEEFAKQDPNTGIRGQHVEVGEDRGAEMRRNAAEAALVMREKPEIARGDKSPYSQDVVKEAQKFRNMTLLDMAKDSLVRGGVDVEGMDKMAIVGRAFTSSSSDFPVLLEGANRTVLLNSYEAQADTWRRFCAVGSVSDFREHKRLRMGSFTDLDAVQENGEFKNKKITDADYEKVSIDTKGNIINVSRKMIINDDLGAFLKLASMLGRAAARSIENDVYALLAEGSGLGPIMADGQRLFHASHGNIATAAAPTIAVLDAMRQKMAIQKDKDSNDFLDIRPALALAPLSLGGTLRLLNNSQYDNDGTAFQKPNIVAGLFRDVIDTPRLTGNAYYMFASPSEEPVIEVNFLNGEQSPYMESEEGFTVDGMKWKIRMDYGIDAVGYRGVVRNAGAGA